MLKDELISKAVVITAAYVARNKMSQEAVFEFLEITVQKLSELNERDIKPFLMPPVPVAESYTDDYIICLEDGQRVTLLKRYLKKNFGMSPEDYIEKWDLPEDYPFVTKAYSEKRSEIAKSHGLGKV